MSESDVDVRFGATIEGFTAGVKQVESQIRELSAPLAEVQESLSAMGEALIAAFAIEKIVDFTKEMAELGEQAAALDCVLHALALGLLDLLMRGVDGARDVRLWVHSLFSSFSASSRLIASGRPGRSGWVARH